MNTQERKAKNFVGTPQHVDLSAIQTNAENPRGIVERNENFVRLVSSINTHTVLVPVVVRRLPTPIGEKKYELLDGERRYWASLECGKEKIPAHVLQPNESLGDFRKVMFHLHMTREQWGALSQCKALSEVYPELKKGIKFSEKAKWCKLLTDDIVMSAATARDRVNVLAWPEDLKDLVYAFNAKNSSKDIYSYILAIEGSVVEASIQAFPEYYNHGHAPEHAAYDVRKALLNKTISGLETGLVSSREQVRSISPLFCSGLEPAKRKIALSIFKKFIDKKDFQFDDVRSDIGAHLPEALKQRAPKPTKIISLIQTLDRTLRIYDPRAIDNMAAREGTKQKLREELVAALKGLTAAADELLEKI